MSKRESTGSFVLNGEGGSLTVEVLGYENLQPHTVSDANWLQTRVFLEAGGCTVRIEAALTTQDVKYFLDELEGMLCALEGSASLTTDEESISVKATIGTTGATRVFGELQELGAARTHVRFELGSDQSFLGERFRNSGIFMASTRSSIPCSLRAAGENEYFRECPGPISWIRELSCMSSQPPS